jgi:hypothetical protein
LHTSPGPYSVIIRNEVIDLAALDLTPNVTPDKAPIAFAPLLLPSSSSPPSLFLLSFSPPLPCPCPKVQVMLKIGEIPLLTPDLPLFFPPPTFLLLLAPRGTAPWRAQPRTSRGRRTVPEPSKSSQCRLTTLSAAASLVHLVCGTEWARLTAAGQGAVNANTLIVYT